MISQKIHPQTIIAGWRRAVDLAREALGNGTLNNK